MWEPKWPISGRSLVQSVSSMKILYKPLPFELCSFLFKPKCGITVNRNIFVSLMPLLLFFIMLLLHCFRVQSCSVQSFSTCCHWVGPGLSWCLSHHGYDVGRHRWILKVCSGRYSQNQYAHFSNHLGMLLLLISALHNRWHCEVPSFVSTWKKMLFLYSHLAVFCKLHVWHHQYFILQ